MTYSLSHRSALALSQAIHEHKITAYELTQQALQRIENAQALDCISQVLTKRALDQAARLDQLTQQGIRLSPLHGIGIIVKDSFDIAGEITQAGTCYLQQTAYFDAQIVEQLERLGLIVLAKAKMTELAFGLSGQNPIQGTPRNPCDTEPVAPGGSSSGCAVAVQAGLALLAVGGDTGGSVRVPAAFNRILGFKPSQAGLNAHGQVPLAQSLDSVGLMAKYPEDLCMLYRLLQPQAEVDTPQYQLTYLAERDFPEMLQPQLLQSWRHLITQLNQNDAQLLAWQPPHNFNFHQLSDACSDIIAYEAYQNYAHLAENPDIKMWSVVRERIQRGADISQAYYEQLLSKRDTCYAAFADALPNHQLLLLPMSPIFAPSLNPEDSSCYPVGAYSRPFNYLDVPACSFPIYPTQQGPAHAAQLVACRGQDVMLLAAVNQIMQTLSQTLVYE